MTPILTLPPTRRARKPSLTPMIDVVFLLLVFFMLVTRFGSDQSMTLNIPQGGGEWVGAPRLLDVSAVQVHLNGIEVPTKNLAPALLNIMPGPDAPVLLRAAAATNIQRLVDVMSDLNQAGITSVIVVE